MGRELRVLLYETPHDPYMNLAFEEAFARARGAGLTVDTLRIWRNSRAVVIGYFQRAREEVDLAAAEKTRVHVVRRFTGGGAVYHDLGNVNFALAVAGNVPDPIDYAYTRLIEGALNALEILGAKPVLENVNDIAVEGRKVSGSAASIRWGTCFIHGTLLVSADLSALSKVLKPPKEKLKAKGVSEVKYRVANLEDVLGRRLSYREIVEALVEGFAKALKAEAYFDMPLPVELEAADLLYRGKYSRREWNLERLPHSAFSKLEEELRALLASSYG